MQGYSPEALDCHITGNWGEDSVDHESSCGGEECAYCDDREFCHRREELMDAEFRDAMRREA